MARRRVAGRHHGELAVAMHERAEGLNLLLQRVASVSMFFDLVGISRLAAGGSVGELLLLGHVGWTWLMNVEFEFELLVRPWCF